MLKRINTADVELGMFVHKLEGSWFKHPFWKSRFLLDDPVLLADLHESEVETVVIDSSKGLDLRPMPVRASAPVRPAARAVPGRGTTRAAFVPPRQQALDLRATGPRTMAREFGLAGAAADKSRKVVSRIFLEARLGKTIKSSQVEPVIEDVFSSIQRNPHAFNGLMRCKRDNEYVYRHALAVSALMISLARQMKLASEEIRLAGMAGLLMDVGIGHLPVDLTEFGGDYRNLPHEVLCGHVELGHRFLQAGGGIPDAVLEVCLLHHEALDGSGYPQGVSGEAIGRLPRMAAICDTYDSMVSDTAEGLGLNPASALAQMSVMKGWFDPAILEQFIETMGIYPIGSVVKLRSGRLAMVVDQDPADCARPRVRAFYSTEQRRLVAPEDIALAQCFGADEIMGIDAPEAYGIPDFPRIRERLFAAAAKDDGFTM